MASVHSKTDLVCKRLCVRERGGGGEWEGGGDEIGRRDEEIKKD